MACYLAYVKKYDVKKIATIVYYTKMCRIELTQVEVNMLMLYKKLILYYIFLSCEVILKYIKSTQTETVLLFKPLRRDHRSSILLDSHHTGKVVLDAVEIELPILKKFLSLFLSLFF